jgi:hypothetical protein
MDDDKKQRKLPFFVEVSGKSYECERVVSGTRVMTQTVTVRGMGTEADAANYGSSATPPIAMEGVATLIAMGIVRKSSPKEEKKA